MIIRSKAPLRLGLGGGGTDVSPYSDLFGGVVLNVSIDLYAHCSIEVTNSNEIEFYASDINQDVKYKSGTFLEYDGILDLYKGVYNRIVNDFNNGTPLSFKMTTFLDAPPGSGLGSSSTLVVAMVKAYVEWLSLPMGEYDIAHLAYQIERIDVGLSGGKQDQYSATFGGFNFIEFYKDDKVIVNPLRIKNWIKDELEESIVLYYSGKSRSSAEIIDQQIRNSEKGNVQTIEGMHQLKEAAFKMKEAILKGDINNFSLLIKNSWLAKKKTASSISNPMIENIFEVAIQNGAISGKISGAGGGGYIMFVVDPLNKMRLVNALSNLEGNVINFHFSEGGCHSWKIYY